MAEKKQFRAIKGVRDILPPESAAWNRVEQAARDVFEAYGYGEIRLPTFEETELFARSIGVDTEVVSKEMYTVLDPFSVEDVVEHHLKVLGVKKYVELLSRTREERLRAFLATPRMDVDSLTLRPEATASVCRAYIEHGMHTRPGNVKLYYIGPMFRRERPQKGRYRQFYQIGAEVLGQSDAPAIDAELIEMLLHFFDKIGLEGCSLTYNSIGCRECRPQYVAALKAALERVRDQLGPDSQRRIGSNPLRVLDSKVESEQAVIETLPRIADHLCAACRDHLTALREQFNLRGIAGTENWRLVRGLDYYTRTTFEITAPGLGAQNAVCGGGRYDGLVELLGGPPTKGIGFAIGTDRVMLSLAEAGKLADAASCDVFVAWMGAAAQAHAIRLARKLRDARFRVEVPAEELKFRKSLDLANRLGARYALIIGENENAAGRFGLKRLADGVQKELTEGELLEFLKGERAM